MRRPALLGMRYLYEQSYRKAGAGLSSLAILSPQRDKIVLCVEELQDVSTLVSRLFALLLFVLEFGVWTDVPQFDV